MIDQYKRTVNKLILELSDTSKLNLDELKFIINNTTQIGIDSIDIDLKNTIDYDILVEIVSFISRECNIYNICIISECIGMQKYIHKLKNVGLKKVVICIDSLKQYKYKAIHGGSNINDIIKTINTCLSLKLETILKCIVVNGFNIDEINDYIIMTKSLPLDICFSEIIPIPNRLRTFQESYVNIESLLEENTDVYKLGSKNKHVYKLINSIGSIYIQSHNDSDNCKSCNEIIITDEGIIKTCIHKNNGFDIKPYIYKPMLFKENIKELIYLRQKNNIEGGAYYG